MQAVLSQQETQLEEKEINLSELRTKLEQLESALEQSKNELLVMQEEPSDQPTAASDHQQQQQQQKETDRQQKEIDRQQKEIDHQRQQELLQTIDSLQNQSNQLKQSFDIERMDLIQQYESAEVKNRDCMEKLREKLEHEKLILSGNVLDKERDIERLKKDMDEMRDNIKVSQKKKK